MNDHELYLIISTDIIKNEFLINVINKLDNISLLLGVETLKILEHQNVARICDYLTSNKKRCHEKYECSKRLLSSFSNF